jgi:fatty-acyl-CoA synthase
VTTLGGSDSGGHLLTLLREQARSSPDAAGIITMTERWSYEQWLAESERVASSLAGDGVGVGDTVALIAPSGPQWLAVAFGCAAVGARLAPFNTWAKGPELEYLLTFVRPKVLITVARWARQDFLSELRRIVPEAWEPAGAAPVSKSVPGLRRLVVIGGAPPPAAIGFGEWLATDRWANEPVSPPDDVALVLFTSGSTARPKGVTLTHKDLIANGFQIGERQGLGPGDRLLLASPLFWSLGSANALPAALTHRTTLVLMGQFDPGDALRLISDERCTAIYTLPTMTDALLRHESFTPARVATLRRGLTFGPPFEVRRVIEELGVDRVCNLYGATEVYGNCVVSPADAPAERRIASSGPPLPGVELRIVDPSSRSERDLGEVGEILVRGRVTPGYLDDSGGYRRVVDAEGWFATGDLGALDAEGWLTFAGRHSEMIKTAGINVSPAEVEDVLLGHDGVAEAAVTGVPHPVRGEQVIAFVRLRPGVTTTPEDIRRWMGTVAASYKVPERVIVVEALPMTTTGKLARRELRVLAERMDHGW